MIKYFLCPHKILRLRVCIFSAGSIEKEFTLIPLVGRDLTLSPCLSSEDVFITELWPRDVQSPHHLPLLLLWTDYPLFRVYGHSLQCWKASRMLPRAEDRQCSWDAGSEGLMGHPAAPALVGLTHGSLYCLEMSLLCAPGSGPFRASSTHLLPALSPRLQA